MKKELVKFCLAAAVLLLTSTHGFAAEVTLTTPDLKGSAKGVVSNVKAGGDAAKSGVKGTVSDAKAAAKAKIVDVNTATEAELKAIPGIGDSYAAKIIAGRPYANKAQLKSRKIIPGVVYEQVKDLLIAKQPKK